MLGVVPTTGAAVWMGGAGVTPGVAVKTDVACGFGLDGVTAVVDGSGLRDGTASNSSRASPITDWMMHWAPVLSMALLYLSATVAKTSLFTMQDDCASKAVACSVEHRNSAANFCVTS